MIAVAAAASAAELASPIPAATAIATRSACCHRCRLTPASLSPKGAGEVDADIGFGAAVAA